jgi:membrane protein YqaA with SNARE-associated domain
VIVAAALLWGFAEATVFFIVPDVLLTLVALVAPRRAVAAIVAALAGAMAGGALMHRHAAVDPAAARALVDAVPAVTAAVLERARALLADGLFEGMVRGSVSGLPFKIFAVETGAEGGGLGAFLAAALPARALRFALAVAATRALALTVFRKLPIRGLIAVWAVFWIVLYAVYFSLIGW